MATTSTSPGSNRKAIVRIPSSLEAGANVVLHKKESFDLGEQGTQWNQPPRAAGRLSTPLRDSWAAPASANEHLSPSSKPNKLKRRSITIETSTYNYREFDSYDQLNQYKLQQEVGSGEFGKVRRCISDLDDRLYAAKCISKRRMKRKAGCFGVRPKGAPKDNSHEALNREIAILTRIRHPHIVHLFEVIEDPKEDIVVMIFEMMSLGSVMDMTEPDTIRCLPELEACNYFRQLLLAVEYLHSHGVIHRDVKPANLLRQSQHVVKLADFGVSHVFEGESATLEKTAGTPAFFAPESIDRQTSTYDGRPVDVWAMGITLFCFLFGQTPFEGGNPTLLVAAIREVDLDLEAYRDALDDPVSDEALDVLSRLLDKKPSNRITIEDLRDHVWLNPADLPQLVSVEENCTPKIEVNHDEIENSLTTIAEQATSGLGVRSTSTPTCLQPQHSSFSPSWHARAVTTKKAPSTPPKSTSTQLPPSNYQCESFIGEFGAGLLSRSTLAIDSPMRSSPVAKAFSPWRRSNRLGATSRPGSVSLQKRLRLQKDSNLPKMETFL